MKHDRPRQLLAAGVLGVALLAVWGPGETRAGDPPAGDAIARPGAARLAPIARLPDGVRSLSFQSCARCHVDVHRGWKLSMHSVSWVDPEVQEVWRHYGKPDTCLDCHLPLAESRRRRDTPAPAGGHQVTLPGEGVTCAACHVRDGVVLVPHPGGTRVPSSKPPHPIRFSDELNHAELCAQCHQSAGAERPMYDTYREWKASPAARDGRSCKHCHMPHMPAVGADQTVVPYHSHHCRGAHADPLLYRALEIDVRTDRALYRRGEQLKATVVVTNTGAGHSVPTGHPLHAIEAIVALTDHNGDYLSEERRWLRRDVSSLVPFKEGDDTRLAPGASLEIPLTAQIPEKGEHPLYLTVQLYYHLLPPELVAKLHIPSEIVARSFDSRVVPLLDF